MKEIKLTRGQVTLVDDSDYDWLNQWKWYAYCRKGANGFYARRSVLSDGKTTRIKMHRLILGLTDPKVQCDHKDGNRLNNQRENLRVATNQQNTQNMRKRDGCSSQYKGVIWHRSGFEVRIGVDGDKKYVGRFTDEVEAAKAYDTVAIKQFGEFAKLNFPE